MMIAMILMRVIIHQILTVIGSVSIQKIMDGVIVMVIIMIALENAVAVILAAL